MKKIKSEESQPSLFDAFMGELLHNNVEIYIQTGVRITGFLECFDESFLIISGIKTLLVNMKRATSFSLDEFPAHEKIEKTKKWMATKTNVFDAFMGDLLHKKTEVHLNTGVRITGFLEGFDEEFVVMSGRKTLLLSVDNVASFSLDNSINTQQSAKTYR